MLIISHRAVCATALGLAAALPSQSSIRGWGLDLYFDTASRDLPASFASAYLFETVVVRADGRLFVQGNNWNHGCEAPPAPPGLQPS